MGLLRVTEGYKMVTEGYTGLQGVTVCYRK